MIKLYLWKISVFDKSVGHIALQLSDGTYISFWPENLALKSKKKGSTKNKSYEDDVKDEDRPADKCLEIFDEMLDQDKIKSWWIQRAEKYNLLWKNCATTIKEAFEIGGMMIPVRVVVNWTTGYANPGRKIAEYYQCPSHLPAEVFKWAKASKNQFTLVLKK